jgi:putative phosphoesterase
MRIAVLSDAHDHLEHLRRALQRVQGCEVLLFCGDMCSPFTLREMAEGFAGPVHTVLGNNDGDVLLMTRVAQQVGDVTLHGDYAELELAGRRVAVVHYPRLAEGLAALGDYDLVCHGHDHQVRVEQVGNTLLLNPGEVMGWKGRSSCAIYDTGTRKAEIVEL